MNALLLILKEFELLPFFRSPRCNCNDFLNAVNKVIFDGNRTLPLAPTIVCRDFYIYLLTFNENEPLVQYFDHIG